MCILWTFYINSILRLLRILAIYKDWKNLIFSTANETKWAAHIRESVVSSACFICSAAAINNIIDNEGELVRCSLAANAREATATWWHTSGPRTCVQLNWQHHFVNIRYDSFSPIFHGPSASGRLFLATMTNITDHTSALVARLEDETGKKNHFSNGLELTTCISCDASRAYSHRVVTQPILTRKLSLSGPRENSLDWFRAH